MTLRKPKFSLAAKFSFLVSLPILIASLVLDYNFVRFSEKGIRIGMIEEGKGIAKTISCSSEYGILVEDQKALSSAIITALRGEDAIYVFIRNKSGEVLVSHGERPVESMSTKVIADDPTVQEQEAVFNFRIAESDILFDVICDVITVREKRSREDIGLLQPDTLSAPRSSRMEKIGTVQIGLSKARKLEYMRKAKLGTAGLTVAVTVLGILATVVLVRVMVKPIRRLAIATGAVSRGDFDQPVEVKSKDERGDLAESFNRMIAALRVSREALQYRLEIERLVTAMSTRFINLAPDEVDSGINHALQTIGEFAGVDFSYVYLFSDDGKKIDKIHKWRAQGIEPQTDNAKGLSVSVFPWMMEKLHQLENIHIPCVADLPPEASAEKEHWQSYGLQSLTFVPMVYGRSLVGILGFSSIRTGKTWMEEDITVLKMVGEIFTNALKRKQAEEQMIRLSNAVKMSTDSIVISDIEGKIIDVNQATLEMYNTKDRGSIIGKRSFDFIVPEDREKAFAGMQEVLDKGYIKNQEYHIAAKNGGRIPVELSASILKGTNGKPIGFVGVSRDITERKRAEEALQQQLEVEERITRKLEEKTEELSKSNEELNAFVYTVSHDLKAPVVSLQGFSSILMRDYEDRFDEIGKMYVERIQKNSEHMGILINNLLELSRIGRIKGQEELVNISDVISDKSNELVIQLEERGTKLIIDDEMPTVKCDRTRISQIFANLISNANKFMGQDNEEPTIEVGYESQDGYHKFYVRDNGIGIDEEYHEKIFQIFQRLDDIETEGTGVGLAIVKKIVENFGGSIWVDSAKGKGSTMYFTMLKKMNVNAEEVAK